ncbi:hypothetical protein Bca101_096202 [Brassica carinata]
MTASFWHRCWTTLGPLIEITDQDSRKVSGLAYSMVMGKHLLKVTRHEIQSKKAMWKMYEQYPHVIFDDFTSLMGKRVGNI